MAGQRGLNLRTQRPGLTLKLQQHRAQLGVAHFWYWPNCAS